MYLGMWDPVTNKKPAQRAQTKTVKLLSLVREFCKDNIFKYEYYFRGLYRFYS